MPHEKKGISQHVTHWQCSRLKSSMPFKCDSALQEYTSLKTTLQKRNSKLKRKMSFEVLNMICPSQEPTSKGRCLYKK